MQDTLDLMTGEVTERIGEVVLDGSQNLDIQFNTNSQQPNTAFVQYIDSRFEKGEAISCILPKANVDLWGASSYDNQFVFNYLYYSENNKKIQILIPYSMLKTIDISGVKQFLSENPIKILLPIKESIKTVVLNSTYEFSPVNTRQVLVEGEILPLICSITTPTEPLSFVLNPNLEEDEQFIAPDFTISNNSPASVSIELKNFEQTTDVLNDVSPTKYQNWSTLDKTQSKDIALAINPKPGDGWENLQEGPRYAADQKGSILGEIKPNSSVDLTFSALHGQAFTKALKPQYRLVFLFDF